ncbi:MAG: ABC transporter ATP-binding protein [Mycoplasmatales bacterium]
MSLVEFKNLELKYPGQKEATLKSLNLQIEEGEFIVVVGPSGCGKSTTLKVLSGLEDVTAGEIYINGELVNYKEPKDRNISMVFQNYALYPHFTVQKNVAFGLKKMGLSKQEITNRVNEVGQMLGITDQFAKMPKDLSGGQQQRVALARAIVRSPLIYIFDEPLSNLDAKLRTKTREEIIGMHKRLKKTFFYVTHDQVEAMTMADRIIVLKDGIIQQFDKPVNIFYNPKNLFVAQFLGTPEINIFTGTKISTDSTTGARVIFGEDLSIDISTLPNVLNYKKEKLYIGIRPDDVHYSLSAKPGYQKLQVRGREILGNSTILNCQSGELTFNILIKTKDFYDELAEIFVEINIGSCYFFDIDTEENING